MLSQRVDDLHTVKACNTIEGMGRDIESAGGAIEKTANENK
ncbi:entericidin A/B family lipoprotein [Ponticaulis profundi]|uniref:Entericidin A/B family lipoprotein n=1 Tax=Ponticaulis profundi TaxID=2665222 RepID=A0ABW1SBL0_9PROT